MVDKAHRFLSAIYSDTSYNVVGILPLFDVLQGVSVYDGEIFDLQSVCRINLRHDLIVSILKAVGLCKLYTFIKIFEYISYLKPILVTDCTETARIIAENHVGWVAKDDVQSIQKKLEELCSHPEEIKRVRAYMTEVRKNNLWTCRAEKVINDFEKTISSNYMD